MKVPERTLVGLDEQSGDRQSYFCPEVNMNVCTVATHSETFHSNHTCRPHGGKQRGSPESVWFMIWGPWMSTQNKIFHPIVADKVLTIRLKGRHSHMAKSSLLGSWDNLWWHHSSFSQIWQSSSRPTEGIRQLFLQADCYFMDHKLVV